MEAENKIRKAGENGDPDRSRKRKLAAAAGLEVPPPPPPPARAEVGTAPPSEAEVEEFFAIVRRMHVAVKYFGQKANGVDGKRPGKWRAALEAEDVVVVAADEAGEVLDDKERVKRAAAATTPAPEGVAEVNGVFDLNSAPEEGCAD